MQRCQRSNETACRSHSIACRFEVFDLGLVREPSLELMWQWRQMLAFNALNSFILNVAIAVFLRYMSPVSYTLTGNIKDGRMKASCMTPRTSVWCACPLS